MKTVDQFVNEIKIAGEIHPHNRIPIAHLDAFKAEHPGSPVKFRGPRDGKAHTLKADATHFYVGDHHDSEDAEHYTYHVDGAPPAHDEIFVFGSNMGGKHAGGAARFAHDKLGAVWGVARGFTGRTYALPTMTENFEPFSLTDIRSEVNKFKAVARSHPDKKFFVTRIACVIAGYSDEDIAPMFWGSPINCNFAERWKQHM